jgi:Flp pilus assembly protein TadG
MKPDCGTINHEPAALRGGRLWRACAKRRGRGERGQAVTEFAMVLPLFAILVFTCILFGKALYIYIQLTHSANEAARLAAVNFPSNQPSGTTLCTVLQSEGAIAKGTTLTISYPDGNSQAVGEPVTVTASADGSWVPVINVGSLTASSTMRIEQNTTGNGVFGTTACTAS